MIITELVKCRSRKASDCAHGQPAYLWYEDGVEDDGTYDPADGTVCCDGCYIAIGMPSIPVNAPNARAFQQRIGR